MVIEIDATDRLLADLIVQGRQSRKLTQERLAEIIGVDHRTIQRWEAGESIPQPSHIDALSTIIPVEMRASFREAVKKISNT
jgi:transcriptional regulator with XRE-family HTH domain